jgi:hypothetical protein
MSQGSLWNSPSFEQDGDPLHGPLATSDILQRKLAIETNRLRRGTGRDERIPLERELATQPTAQGDAFTRNVVGSLDDKLHLALRKLGATSRELRQTSNEVELLSHKNVRFSQEVDALHQHRRDAETQVRVLEQKVRSVQIAHDDAADRHYEQQVTAKADMDKKVNFIHASWSIASAEAEMARMWSELHTRTSEERTNEAIAMYQGICKHHSQLSIHLYI